MLRAIQAVLTREQHRLWVRRTGIVLDWWCWERRALLLQLLGTLLVLGWVPGNGYKLAAMLLVWIIGFGRLSLVELGTAGLINLIFIAMDGRAVENHIFVFQRPDLFGLPAYEFFMWGFYLIHLTRFFNGPEGSPRRISWAIGLALVFSLTFTVITDPVLLAGTAGTVVAISFVAFHEPLDLLCSLYMGAIGALVEYVGVGTGQWSYPDAHAGGVPIWSFAMWSGVGLFSRRLLVPLLLYGQRNRRV